MRVNTLLDDLRQSANIPGNDGKLMVKAAQEIEFLRAGYQRIMHLSSESIERGALTKILEEYT